MANELLVKSDPAMVVSKLIATGIHNDVTHHPLGYLHDAIGFFLICAFPYSLVCVVKDNRQKRRLAKFLCPSCKYDMRGLPSGTCPECGHSITV